MAEIPGLQNPAELFLQRKRVQQQIQPLLLRETANLSLPDPFPGILRTFPRNNASPTRQGHYFKFIARVVSAADQPALAADDQIVVATEGEVLLVG
jgi:hypothetical protein